MTMSTENPQDYCGNMSGRNLMAAVDGLGDTTQTRAFRVG